MYRRGKPQKEAGYDPSSKKQFLLCFSAHDNVRLERNIQAVRAVAEDYDVAGLCQTLNLNLTRSAHRAFMVVREGQKVHDFNLTSLKKEALSNNECGVGFLFTGQGAQWDGMGRVAFFEYPTFRDRIEKLDAVLSRLTPKPIFKIVDMLLGHPTMALVTMDDAEIAQPLTTAIQIALVDLFSEWGVNPTVSIGHSSGEIGAAYAAGLISAPEALVVAFSRGCAVKEKSDFGSMLAVGLGINEVQPFLSSDPEKICVACENSSRSVTLSGETHSIGQLRELLNSKKIFAREIKTGRAYHSPHMRFVGEANDRILSQALKLLTKDELLWRRKRSHMISSVTGELCDFFSEDYWNVNLRQRVLFSTAVERMVSDSRFKNVSCVVELGPQSALSGPFKQICRDQQCDSSAYIPSMARKKDDVDQLLSAAGSLFLEGYNVDLEGVNKAQVIDGTELKTPDLLDRGEVEIQVEFAQWGLRSAPSLLVSGRVIRVGSSVAKGVVGKYVMAVAYEGLQAVVRTSVYAVDDVSGQTSPAMLVGILGALQPLANAYLLGSNFEEGSHIVSLPGPCPMTVTTILLAQALGCELTVVVKSDAEREAYLSQFNLRKESVLPSSNIDTLMTLMNGKSEDTSLSVIAHDLSMLSQEVWRSIRVPGSFFLLSNEPLPAAPDATAFNPAVSFVPISLGMLRNSRTAAQELLNESLDLVKTYRELLSGDSFVKTVNLEEIASIEESYIQDHILIIQFDRNGRNHS